MSTIGTLLRLIGELFIMFSRLVLTVSALAFGILSLLILMVTYRIKYAWEFVELDQLQRGTGVLFGLGIYVACLALYCVYALCSSSESGIKLFALLSVANVVACLFALNFVALQRADFEQSLEQRLERDMQLYDWRHSNGTQKAVRVATDAWDRVQSSQFCCGIRSARDWHKFEPLLEHRVYPTSCCDGPGPFCAQDNVYPSGCLATGTTMLLIAAALVFATIGCSLLIVLLSACKFLTCRPKCFSNQSADYQQVHIRYN